MLRLDKLVSSHHPYGLVENTGQVSIVYTLCCLEPSLDCWIEGVFTRQASIVKRINFVELAVLNLKIICSYNHPDIYECEYFRYSAQVQRTGNIHKQENVNISGTVHKCKEHEISTNNSDLDCLIEGVYTRQASIVERIVSFHC